MPYCPDSTKYHSFINLLIYLLMAQTTNQKGATPASIGFAIVKAYLDENPGIKKPKNIHEFMQLWHLIPVTQKPIA